MEKDEVDDNKFTEKKRENTRENCDVCGIQYIHRNDWENHIHNRKHINRLKAKNKEHLKNDTEDFPCTICGKKFKDYNIHLTTKAHIRSQKAKERSILQDPFSTAKVKYKKLNMKTYDLNYKSYIYSLTAYLSLRLALNHDVEDFVISVNDKRWKAFGHINISMVYKEKNIIYAIQCKQVNQTSRQINCLEDAKVHIENTYDQIAEIRTSIRDLRMVKFVIFTTCSTSSDFCKPLTLKSKTVNKWKVNSSSGIPNDATIRLKPLTKKNDLINVTSEPDNTFSFVLMDNLECELPHLFLYTNQRVDPTTLHHLLKLRFDNHPDMSKEYLNYIEDWGGGKLGGDYKLTKKDIILKLSEILLEPFTISTKEIYSYIKDMSSFDKWNNVINNVDLTVVKNDPFIMRKICQPLNKIIEETLSTKINIVTNSISLQNRDQSELMKIKDPLRSHLFKINQDHLRGDIPLHLVYKVFWKAGMIPLLLSSEDREECKYFILEIISFMKLTGVNKKFLLKSADLQFNLFNEQITMFTSLHDIKHLINLDEIKIRVSNSFNLPLSIIQSSDPFFFKSVTPNMFFDLSLGKYSLRAVHQKKLKKKNDMKLILCDTVKEMLENSLHADLPVTNFSSYRVEKLRAIDPGLF